MKRLSYFLAVFLLLPALARAGEVDSIMDSFIFSLGLLMLLIGVPGLLLWFLIRTVSRGRKPKIPIQHNNQVKSP